MCLARLTPTAITKCFSAQILRPAAVYHYIMKVSQQNLDQIRPIWTSPACSGMLARSLTRQCANDFASRAHELRHPAAVVGRRRARVRRSGREKAALGTQRPAASCHGDVYTSPVGVAAVLVPSHSASLTGRRVSDDTLRRRRASSSRSRSRRVFRVPRRTSADRLRLRPRIAY